MAGGFIWDWVDQGIYAPGTNHVFYGGDFGDKPNLKAFCLNGVVFSDRSVSAKYHEVKQVYAPVWMHQRGGEVWVVNHHSHLSLQGMTCRYEVMEEGKCVKRGQMVLGDVLPGDSAQLCRLRDFRCSKNKDTRLHLSVVDQQGREVGMQQVALTDNLMDTAWHLATASLKTYQGDKSNKWEVTDSIVPQFFRAPTDNDKSFGNWLAKDWKKTHLDSTLAAIPLRDGEYTYHYGEDGKEGGNIHLRMEVRPAEDGFVDVNATYSFEGNLPELPRLGLMLKLPGQSFDQLKWYGRGPRENYPDRKQSCPIGLYESSVDGQFTHYPRPQDNGNHEECSFIELTSKGGKSLLQVVALQSPISFSALPYSVADIYGVQHDFELKQPANPSSRHTYLSLDCAVLGLGNSSCGPGVLKKYAIDKSKTYTLHFLLRRKG